MSVESAPLQVDQSAIQAQVAEYLKREDLDESYSGLMHLGGELEASKNRLVRLISTGVEEPYKGVSWVEFTKNQDKIRRRMKIQKIAALVGFIALAIVSWVLAAVFCPPVAVGIGGIIGTHAICAVAAGLITALGVNLYSRMPSEPSRPMSLYLKECEIKKSIDNHRKLSNEMNHQIEGCVEVMVSNAVRDIRNNAFELQNALRSAISKKVHNDIFGGRELYISALETYTPRVTAKATKIYDEHNKVYDTEGAPYNQLFGVQKISDYGGCMRYDIEYLESSSLS